MKRFLAIVLSVFSLAIASCGKEEEYVLSEKSFFLVMTNIQYYPSNYVGKNLEFDCFTYEIKDTDGNSYICGVRKCSSGYGCNCGKDTVIGFILDYGGEIPEPKNQSEDTNDKSWVRLKGKIDGDKFTEIAVYAYNGDEIDYSTVETIKFLTLKVDKLSVIEDYSGLSYYVSK